jgi:RNA polymerase sigma-70 factor (ECF subfamily)
MAMECANFERIYDEHSGLVYRTAYGVLANPAQAQDVVQDVFMRLWRRPGDFDVSRGPLPNYLRLLARSRALDMWREAQVAGRARARMRVLALRDEGRADDRPALAVELRRDRWIVLAALARIPAMQRQAIVMAYWGGLTADEIAASCGVPVGTIKSRIRLGLMKLRERTADELAVESRQLAA